MMTEQISIGRFSQITRLTQKALRLYDQRGLLIPDIKDPITGYRYYSAAQIENGIKIKTLAELGFSLKQIEVLLTASEKKDYELIKDVFSKRLKMVKQEIQRLKKIEEILLENASLEELFMNTSEPSIKEISKIRVITKKDKTPLSKIGLIIGNLIQEIFTQIYGRDNQGGRVTVTGPPMFICHDEVLDESEVNVEIAVPITGKINVSEDFEVKNLPGGKVVSTIHTGSYSSIGEAYTRVFEFAQKNGFEIVGPTREIYISDPNEKAENELITEIQIPIE